MAGWQKISAFFTRTKMVDIATRLRRLRKPLQTFFHWQYSGGPILFFGAAVIALASIDSFRFAYTCAALFCMWSLGFGSLRKN
jgi:hypothetical protein